MPDLTGTPGVPTGGAPTGVPSAGTETPQVDITTHPAYKQLQGEFTRVTQENARIRNEMAEYEPVLPILRNLAADEGGQELLTKRWQEQGILPQAAAMAGPTVPTGSGPQTPEVAALAAQLAASNQKLAEIEKWRWAMYHDQEWGKADAEFNRVMGRPMNDGEKQRAWDYLQRTGAGDLWSSVLVTNQQEFIARAAQLQIEGAKKGAEEAARMASQGATDALAGRKINVADPNYTIDSAREMARAYLGLTGESTRYAPDVTR